MNILTNHTVYPQERGLSVYKKLQEGERYGRKKSNREKLSEITASIERGIKELFESDRYVDYLQTMSRFHSYSVRNTILIHMQRPDATVVAGFNAWKKKFQRHVKKGEKGITILAPTPYKKKIEEKAGPGDKIPHA